MVKGVHLKYHYNRYVDDRTPPGQVTALDDFSLYAGPGAFVGILGKNGSGKSTLARILAALFLPDSGQVMIKGMDSSLSDNLPGIRRTLGIVFQDPDNQLLGTTVEEDMAFGLENLGLSPEEMEDRIAAGLAKMGLSSFRTAPAASLSGGQKQKLALAGILAMEPDCIILDEPTAMIDPRGRDEFFKILLGLRQEKGITVIYITHHPEELEEADRIYLMDKGKLVLADSPREIWRQPDLVHDHGVSMPFIYELESRLKDKERFHDIYRSPVPQSSVQESPARQMSAQQSSVRESSARQLAASQLSDVQSPDVQSSDVQSPDGQLSDVQSPDGQLSDVQSSDVQSPDGQSSDGQSVAGEGADDGICLENVSFSYVHSMKKEAPPVLDRISLSLSRGEFIALIGETGSGKTTLLQIMNGLLRPLEGSCSYQGKDIHKKGYPLGRLRQKLVLGFQNPDYQLFEETVLKDICFGPSNMGLDQETCLARARRAMDLTGLPPELENVSPLALSGGQKRRTALAGLLAMEPDWLLLDEPAAGLDQEGKEMLFRLLTRLNENQVSIVMVTHDMNDAAAYAHRVIVMKEGRILADGKTADIMADSQLLKKAGLSEPDCVSFYRKYLAGRPGQGEEEAGPVPLTLEELADHIEMNRSEIEMWF